MTELRGEMAELRIELRDEIVETRGDNTAMHSQLTVAMIQMSSEMRRLFLVQMTLMVALFGVVIAVVGAQ